MKPYLLIAGLFALLFPLSGVAGSSPDEPLEIPETIHMSTVVGDVDFPHAEHVSDYGAECTDCHHPTNGAPLTMPHQRFFKDFWIDCTECHLQDVRSKQIYDCSKCHPRGHRGVSNKARSAKAFIHKTCWECHEVGVGAEASATCSTCHQEKDPGDTPVEH